MEKAIIILEWTIKSRDNVYSRKKNVYKILMASTIHREPKAAWFPFTLLSNAAVLISYILICSSPRVLKSFVSVSLS